MARKQKGIDAARWFALASLEGAFLGDRGAIASSSVVSQMVERAKEQTGPFRKFDSQAEAAEAAREWLAARKAARLAQVIPIRPASTWVSDVPCAGAEDSLRATMTASIFSVEVRKCS